MTNQTNLGLIWALTGGVSDPGNVKYQTGWIAEVPTFQNFNFVLQSLDNNLLAKAEKGEFTWQNDINYLAGTRVLHGGTFWTCITNNINTDPTADILNDYWVHGMVYGSEVPSTLLNEEGLKLTFINGRTPTNWEGNDLTIKSANALISLQTSGVGTKNWLLGNVSGELVAVDVGTTAAADSRSIALSEPNTYQIYHEGFKPAVGDVAGAVEEAPLDSKLYARINESWLGVTTTVVTDAPPPPSVGSGTGWYNLGDGKFYIDINDGDSSQWVPANPPQIPVSIAADVEFDPMGTPLVSTNVQDALIEIYNLI